MNLTILSSFLHSCIAPQCDRFFSPLCPTMRWKIQIKLSKNPSHDSVVEMDDKQHDL